MSEAIFREGPWLSNQGGVLLEGKVKGSDDNAAFGLSANIKHHPTLSHIRVVSRGSVCRTALSVDAHTKEIVAS